MIIKSVHVKNFRCIADETLHCEALTALVGPNGAGKSSFLRALDLFYAPNPRFVPDDFHANDTSRDVEIAITFADLDDEEKELFKPYVDGDDLTVVRVLSLASGKQTAKFYGASSQIPEFSEIRGKESAKEIRTAYDELRQQDSRFKDLPAAASKDAVLTAMAEWEQSHPDQCRRARDDGQFFGFTSVGQGYLGRHTKYISIPAVRDASEDAAEGKGSPITELINLVVRSVIASREDLTQFKLEMQQRYAELMKPENINELQALQQSLTETLRKYVPSSGVALTWQMADSLDVPLPTAAVKLEEDGYLSAVARSGHGLQRAFIMTLLQHLAVAREPINPQPATDNTDQMERSQSVLRQERIPNLVLGIEEPELYQHPSRQRHIARMLLELATGALPGVAQKTQIIYCTHSPLFVGLDRFDQVRLLRKVSQGQGKPKKTTVVRSSLDQVASAIGKAAGESPEKFVGSTVRPRLQTIMTPWMNEGFFADVVVLVEGEDDRAALIGVAAVQGIDFDGMGITVIPCIGKNNIDRPATIFQLLGIPTYLVWDSDRGRKGANPCDNHLLLRLLGETQQDWPCVVHDRFACFEQNLEVTLRNEIGMEEYDAFFAEAQVEFGISDKSYAAKFPAIYEKVLHSARSAGRASPTLELIVQKIVALKSRE